jgi:drug/metabolite transporter (DMT)-like permease
LSNRLNISPRLGAALQALFVTFLWSSSFVLIKFGLQDIPALTFAGLRYTVAFLCLAPFVLASNQRASLRRLSRADWLRLACLGALFYSFTQGAQFAALALLPAVATSLLWNFSTVAVALMGAAWLAERPNRVQWLGIALNLAGVLLYFYPPDLPAGRLAGILVALAGVLANAASSILGRSVNRAAAIPTLVVTAVSMGIGGPLLLAVGIVAQGLPQLGLAQGALVGWLAVVNTALAFTLWNHSLRVLSAVESSIINGSMLIQIAVLAWIFLGERLTVLQVLGLAFAGAGMLAVQLRRNDAL